MKSIRRWHTLLCVALLGCASGGGTSSESPIGDASGILGDEAGASSDAGPGTLVPDASVGGDAAAVHDAGGKLDSGVHADGSVGAADSAADTSSAAYGPYGNDGPNTFTQTTVQVPAPNGTFTATVYIPNGSGPMPVVFLSCGLQQKAAGYGPYAERLASWGIITLLRDDPGALASENGVGLSEDVGYTVATWLATANTTSGGPLYGKVDTSNVGLAGHSRGGQVSLLAAAGPLHGLLKGVFGLDPVDSAGDAGVGLAAAGIANIGLPLAFIGETTDDSSTQCAPSADDYLTLYKAAASPIVAITAVNADHTMFEDPNNCTACFICTKGSASAATVLAYAQRYLMAYFARQLLGDTSVGATFTGAGIGLDLDAGLVQVESK